MKLSIILPVYNVEEYLEECLESLINQDYSPYEIIAVNDGSTDNSLKILKKYEKKYPKLLKVYSKENGGLSRARNFGMEHAKGKYLFFVDSDDYILPNALKILGKHLDKDYDIIGYPFIMGNEEHSEFLATSNKSTEDKQKRLITGSPGAQNKICKKELYSKNNITFLEDVYYEDLATTPKLALYTKKIKFIDDPLYFYRVRPNSIMTNPVYNPKVDAIFIVLEQLKEYFDGRYKEEIEYLYIEHLLRGASLRYLGFQNCQEQLDRIVKIMKENYPNWSKNKYYKKENLKKKVMYHLLYKKQYKLISILRKF